MMKHRSSVEPSIAEHYFAVHPVSLRFERQCTSKLQLYFQKGLQIISKHQSPLAQIRKDEIVVFPQPQQGSSFRIQSEKSIDYQWSLYALLEDNDEDFLESQKITLREAWSVYRARGVTHSQQNIRFNAIRCQLNYVVIIANSNREVLDLAQHYFTETKIQAVTTGQKLAAQSIKAEENQKVLQPQSDNIDQHPLKKVEQNAEQGNEKVTEFRQSVEEIQLSNIITKGHSFQSQAQNKNAGQLLTPRDEQNPKISTSELEIGKQMEERVNNEDNLKEQTILLAGQCQKVTQDGDLAKAEQAEERKEPVQSEEANVRTASAQTSKDKMQVGLPLYKQKKFLIALISIIFLMLGAGFVVLGKKKPAIPEKPKNERSKAAKENKKQAQKKKPKGKK